MALGALSTKPGFADRPTPMHQLLAIAESTSTESKCGLPIPHVFGAAAEGYLKKYGGGIEHLARIGEYCVTLFLCVV